MKSNASFGHISISSVRGAKIAALVAVCVLFGSHSSASASDYYNCTSQNCEAPAGSTGGNGSGKPFNLITDTSASYTTSSEGVSSQSLWSPFDTQAEAAQAAGTDQLSPAYSTGDYGNILYYCYEITDNRSQGIFIPMGSPAEFASFINSSFARTQGGATVGPCVANPLNDCGADSGESFASAPTGAGLCNSAYATPSGGASLVGAVGSQSWQWSCVDNTSGLPATCTATYIPGCSGGQTQLWNGTAPGCQGAAPAGSYASGATVPNVSNTVASLTGTATFTCNNGTWTASGTCTSSSSPTTGCAITEVTTSVVGGDGSYDSSTTTNSSLTTGQTDTVASPLSSAIPTGGVPAGCTSGTCEAAWQSPFSGSGYSGTTTFTYICTPSSSDTCTLTASGSNSVFSCQAGGACTGGVYVVCTNGTGEVEDNWGEASSGVCSGSGGGTYGGGSYSGGDANPCQMNTNGFTSPACACASNSLLYGCGNQTETWTVGGLSCSGSVSTVSSGQTVTASDTGSGGNTGSASYTCVNGMWEGPSSATCAASSPCPAGWINTGSACVEQIGVVLGSGDPGQDLENIQSSLPSGCTAVIGSEGCSMPPGPGGGCPPGGGTMIVIATCPYGTE